MAKSENQTQTRRSKWLEVIVTCAILAAMVYFTPVWAVLTTPTGHDIPRAAPNEDNRVYHPYGFSIIAPPNWRATVSVDSPIFRPSIGMGPQDPLHRRYAASVGVSMHDKPPEDLAEYTPVTFQGKPAFQQILLHPDHGLEDPGQFTYTLAFERENQWYRIEYHLFDMPDLRHLPPEVQPYVDSFQIHRRPEPTTANE